MKEHPMLFSQGMVNKIRTGHKTQVRRIIKPQPVQSSTNPLYLDWKDGSFSADDAILRHSPFQPGDHIWVRETWGIFQTSWTDYGWEPQGLIDFSTTLPKDRLVFSGMYGIRKVVYAADGYERDKFCEEPGFKASIHMPRWASRITLEITSVRIERLQNISERDCAAEGFGGKYTREYKRPRFQAYWNKLYDNWDANPWVWVIDFKVVKDARVRS